MYLHYFRQCYYTTCCRNLHIGCYKHLLFLNIRFHIPDRMLCYKAYQTCQPDIRQYTLLWFCHTLPDMCYILCHTHLQIVQECNYCRSLCLFGIHFHMTHCTFCHKVPRICLLDTLYYIHQWFCHTLLDRYYIACHKRFHRTPYCIHTYRHQFPYYMQFENSYHCIDQYS